MDFNLARKAIKEKKLKSSLLLHGEEPLFIDKLCKDIELNYLEEGERDFDQTVIYGRDVNATNLIGELKLLPLLAPKKVVIIKEAQMINKKDHEILAAYFKQVNESCCFIFAYKYGKLDGRGELFKAFKAHGDIFLSDKIRDYQLVDWIIKYVESTKFKIDFRAASILAENIGNDLSRIVNEIEKLHISLPEGTAITDKIIEENIGISKEYNVFELVKAVQKGDYLRSCKIAFYFEHNPKSGPLVLIIGQLFSFFIKLMRFHFSPNKSREDASSIFRLPINLAQEVIEASKIYPPKRIANKIAILHEYDLKSKGVNSTGEISDADLLKELLFKIHF